MSMLFLIPSSIHSIEWFRFFPYHDTVHHHAKCPHIHCWCVVWKFLKEGLWSKEGSVKSTIRKYFLSISFLRRSSSLEPRRSCWALPKLVILTIILQCQINIWTALNIAQVVDFPNSSQVSQLHLLSISTNQYLLQVQTS